MSTSPTNSQVVNKNEENVYEVPPGTVTSPLDINQPSRGSQNSLNDSNEDADRANDASSKKSNSSSTLSTLVSPEKRARGYTEYLTPSLPNALDTLSQGTQQSSTGTSICGLSDKSGARNQRRASRASKLSAASHRSSVPKKVPRTRHKTHKTVDSTPQLTSFNNNEESRGNLTAPSNHSIVTSSPAAESKALIFDQLPKTSIPSIQSAQLEQIAAQIEASAAASVSQTAPFIANRKRSSIVSNRSTGKNGSKGTMYTSRVCTRQHYPSGLYGWRKRSLYFIILLTSCITVINLSLLAYLYTVLDLSLLDGTFGGGSVVVSSEGINVAGTAVFFNSTLASRYIRSTQADEPLTIQSDSDHILLSSLHSTPINDHTVAKNHRINETKSLQRLIISPDSVNIMSNRLHIRKSNGDLLFSADGNKFTVASDHLRILHDYAFNLKKSLETPFIQSHFSDDLQIASITRGVKISSAGALDLTSKAGDVSIYSLQDLTLKSAAGKIIIDASKIHLNNLKRVSPPLKDIPVTTSSSPVTTSSSNLPGKSYDNDATIIYQVCSCSDGRLFLVHADSTCLRDLHLCS